MVIKPADKGSAVVVMDREQYLWEGKRQLQDTNYYTKLDTPLFPETAKLVTQIVDKLLEKKFINKKQHIPPGRPIISDCSSEMYYTAEFLHFYLNPLSTTHDSYIKDT